MRTPTWSQLFLLPSSGPDRAGARPGNLLAALASWAVVLLALSLLCWVVYTRARYNWQWDMVWAYRNALYEGWLTTIWISALALVLSLVLGTVNAMLLRSRFLPARFLARLYVDLVRGSPLIVILLLGYYAVLDTLFQMSNAFQAGILLLSIFSGAYISEIIRGGVEAVGATQRESALAIGLTRVQMYRFVIIPQTIRHVLPALAGQFANVIKDSSLLYAITVPEFTAAARNVNSATYSALEAYIPLALGYLILTIPIILFSRWLERRMKFET